MTTWRRSRVDSLETSGEIAECGGVKVVLQPKECDEILQAVEQRALLCTLAVQVPQLSTRRVKECLKPFLATEPIAAKLLEQHSARDGERVGFRRSHLLRSRNHLNLRFGYRRLRL